MKDLKHSQSASCSSCPPPVALKDDIYAQVLGEDRSGRVRGVGTGPTPSSLWGSSHILQVENNKLQKKVKELEERVAKVEQSGVKVGAVSMAPCSSVASIQGGAGRMEVRQFFNLQQECSPCPIDVENHAAF